MSSTTLDTNYLVIGAGAMGLAFADEIINGSNDKHVFLVDRRAHAGGHWNDAYTFVRLHQSALFYGVNSEDLGSGDPRDLASKAEILSYDEKIIKQLTATGRFRFLPLCDYQNGRVISTASGTEYDIKVRCKTVDATYMNVTVPSTTPPKFNVADDVNFVPINGLATLTEPYDHYCVIGSGKTGMDAVLYLLEQNVDPECIRWIMPNDAWFQDRESTMPKGFIDFSKSQIKALSSAKSTREMFEMQESDGVMMRLDPSRLPTKFRCATVSRSELTELRRLTDIVRMGRITEIRSDSLVLESGSVEPKINTLYVDCSANGLERRERRPIFEADRITLQPVIMCQQVSSSAMIAATELRVEDADKKNKIIEPVQHPEVPADLPGGMWSSFFNVQRLIRLMPWWMMRSRLIPTNHAGVRLNLQLAVQTWKYFPSDEQVEGLLEEAEAARTAS